MKGITKYRNSMAIMAFVFLSVVVFEKCISNGLKPGTAKGPVDATLFAGAAACLSCHKEITESHTHTPHALTSGIAGDSNIKGSFNSGENQFVFTPNTFVAMEKRPDGYYQVAYNGGTEKLARKFDIVVGSGTKGQTYLFWNAGNNLFQLPITYFTATNQWCNSPGYTGKVIFDRPITSRCLECHTTYANTVSATSERQERYNPATMMYGVTCEKCHGPAAAHVTYQTQHPTEKAAKFILNPASLSRQQNLDMCALCHGGKMQKTTPSFSFTAGNALADYFVRDTSAQATSSIDVHGNQLGLLAASKCFKASKTMTCNNCHNSHVKETGQMAVFSQRCISCHVNEHVHACKMGGSLDSVSLKRNCIDCHMPLEVSKAIVVMLPGADVPTPAKMRSHFIKIYPDETKKFLEWIKASPGTL